MHKPKNIPENAQLISGIGASCWFDIITEDDQYRINRYDEDGTLDCSRIFNVDSIDFDLNKPYKFTYISNCKQCKIIQNNKIFTFNTEDHEY